MVVEDVGEDSKDQIHLIEVVCKENIAEKRNGEIAEDIAGVVETEKVEKQTVDDNTV